MTYKVVGLNGYVVEIEVRVSDETLNWDEALNRVKTWAAQELDQGGIYSEEIEKVTRWSVNEAEDLEVTYPVKQETKMNSEKDVIYWVTDELEKYERRPRKGLLVILGMC